MAEKQQRERGRPGLLGRLQTVSPSQARNIWMTVLVGLVFLVGLTTPAAMALPSGTSEYFRICALGIVMWGVVMPAVWWLWKRT